LGIVSPGFGTVLTGLPLMAFSRVWTLFETNETSPSADAVHLLEREDLVDRHAELEQPL
jgi:hypothetical protein